MTGKTHLLDDPNELMEMLYPSYTLSPNLCLMKLKCMSNCFCMILFCSLMILAPKPFAEMSVMIRKSEHSDINQFKYVLVTLTDKPFGLQYFLR